MINVAIVGLGYIAEKAALGVKYSNSANLYMAVSRSKEKAELFAKDLEINKTGTFEEMLNDPNVQLVYLCTSNNVHYEQIKDCLNNEKHVICKKPMVICRDEMEELFSLAKLNNVFLMEAEKTLFSLVNQGIQEVIKSGIIGEVNTIVADYSYAIDNMNYDSNHWVFSKDNGGVLLDIGVYPLCFALLHTNSSIKNITSYCMYDNTNTYDKYANAIIEFDNNIIANITTSWLYQSPNRGTGYIYGTKGYIHAPAFWKNNYFEVITDNNVDKIIVDQKSEFSGQIDHACQMIRENKYESDYYNEDMHLVLNGIITEIKNNKGN